MDQSALLTLLIVRGATLLLVVVLARLLAALALAALARATLDPARARRLGALAVRVGPGLARGAIAALVGLGVGLSATGVAVADPSPSVDRRAVEVPVLDRVIATAAPRSSAPPTDTDPPGTHPRAYVVRPGDSLWSIARSALGPRATSRDVAADWPRWHHANRAVIGADPGLIHPGQRLRAPAPEPTR